MSKYFITADQGTTSSRAVLFNESFQIVDIVQNEFTQLFPKEGYVEHDPMEIYSSQYAAITQVITQNRIEPTSIVAIGIANQRETTVVWDKTTGIPIYNAIVWQCRRTASICEELINKGYMEYIRDTTGLVVDAYFSATKIKWILDNVSGAREKAKNKELLFGTVDTWLVYNMTKRKVHVTDYTNASRTMLFDIHKLCWDKKICDELDIPTSMLPEVRSSSEVYGYFNFSGVSIPIAGIAGDQQAALFGQRCFLKGDTKNTYGTGCFLLMNTGKEAVKSKNGLITTIAATPKGEEVQYALEGSVFVAGAVIQWLRDGLGIIKNAFETEELALNIDNTKGVYIVPAFTGLGAPHWDMYARGIIVGITRGTGVSHIVRAALESIAYQSDEVIKAMEQDVNYQISTLKVDGGASSNNFLMQFQSDISSLKIIRPEIIESTALGASYLAALAVGYIKNFTELLKLESNDSEFTSKMLEEERIVLVSSYKRAVERAKNWEVSEE